MQISDSAFHFREFSVELTGATASAVIAACRAEGIEPGVELDEHRLLVCITEMVNRDDIDRLAATIASALN